MELLTGKAREKFLQWVDSDEDILCGLDLFQLNITCENALIIDFFDSVGIYVNAIQYNGKFKPIADYQLQSIFNKRQEAITAGIKKANEIFNSKF